MTNRTMDIHFSQGYPRAWQSPLCTANSLYAAARKRARQGQFWSSLTGRSQGLLALKQVRAACTIQGQSEGGVRTVLISQIRGSEGRSHYFDRDFNPLYDHTKGRWLSIATARQHGKALPAVALVQVGDIYFVQDGHHRISVARAMGQKAIDAKVIVWQVTGSLPWESSALAPRHGLTGRMPEIERTFQELRRGCARLLGRVMRGVQVLGRDRDGLKSHGQSVMGG